MLRLIFILLIAFNDQAWAASKHVRLACYDLNPYVSKDRAEHGYLYEVVTQALTASGYTFDIEFFPPARAKKLVETGAKDLLIPSYASPEDAETLLFSQPIHGSQIGYIQLASEQNPNEKEKSKTSLAYYQTLNEANANEANGNVEADGLFGEEEGVIKSSSSRILSTIEMLSTKRIRLAVADKLQVADVLVNRRPNLIGKLKFIVPALATKDFHVAISRKHPTADRLLDDFQRGLDSLRISGEYDRILIRYGYQIPTADTQTLTIGTVANSDMETMRELSKEFMKLRPGVRINWYPLEENLLRRSVLSSMALNDKLFDVVSIGNYDSAIYASNAWLQPLDIPASYDQGDILKPVLDSLSYKGKAYSLPVYGESSMTYYRSDVFAKAGLKMPEQPTYTEIREFAKKIHRPKEGLYGICLRGKPGWGENIPLITTMVNVFGGSWFNKAKEPDLTSKAWVDAVVFYKDLLVKYGPPQPEEHGYQENLKLFAEGRCGMWIDATVAAGYLLNPKHSKVSKSTRFVKAPFMHLKEGSHWLWTWSLAIPKTSDKRALAQEFIMWATSKSYIQLVARHKGWLSVPPGTRRSVHESSAYRVVAPFSDFVRRQIETALKSGSLDEWGRPKRGTQFVGIPEFTALGTSVGIYISLALQEQLSVEKALEMAQQEAKNTMRQSMN